MAALNMALAGVWRQLHIVDVANESRILSVQLIRCDESDVCNIINSKIKHELDTNADSIQTETPDTDHEPTQSENTEITVKKKDNDQLIRCKVCRKYKCATKEQMVRHMRVHRGENRWQCALCDYSTSNSVVFEGHMNCHNGLKPYKCKFCDYRCALKSNAVKHELKKHHKNNPLKCKDCSFIGVNQNDLNSHRKKTHRLDERICKLCNRMFPSAIKKKSHSAKPKQCKLCPFVTCTKTFYDKHLKEDHSVKETVINEKNKSTKIEDIKIFKCARCPWSAETENLQNILLHLIHHPNQTVNENIVDITVLRNCGIMH
ncbi:zinc-finger double domain-containing protein [Phthorimaea operculella]|nr:zinc-finger double domain-containing protein [Phthorimaea operculella]